VSLRDQFVAKGIVSKKRAAEVNRELKKKRKAKQSKKRKKKAVEAESAIAQAAARAEAKAERQRKRKERELERDASELGNRVKQIIVSNRRGVRGKLRFYHRTRGSQIVQRMQVSERAARDLRCGQLAIAQLDEVTGSRWFVISRKAALKLQELAPETLVHFVTDTTGISAREYAFLTPTWSAELGPHRVAPGEDLSRFLEPS